jgi:hypothetical protein
MCYKRQAERLWTGFILLRKGTVVGFSEYTVNFEVG